MYKISEIKNPQFIKELNINNLKQLAKAIREFLVQNVAKNDESLGSNFSVIELTIALHYVFDLSIDKVLFDGGYQSYCHKILTGRAQDFAKIRKFDGLSGYFDQTESSFDCLTCNQTGNTVAKALGIALARDLHADSYETICVIGEDSLMSGRTLASLKEISNSKHKVIIILNDNGETTDKSISYFSKAVNSLRTSDSYLDLKDGLKNSLEKNPIGHTVLKAADGIKNGIKNQIVDGGIFDTFSIDYQGPIDGHNFKELIKALNKAKNSPLSSVIHIVTSKTKGFELLNSQNKNSNQAGYIYRSAKQHANVPNGYIDFSEAVIQSVKDLMHAKANTVCITTSNHFNNGFYKVFNTFPKRCLSFECNEENAIGTAIGLSKEGIIPLINMDASYVLRIIDDLFDCLINEKQKIVLLISNAGLIANQGRFNQGIFDLTFLSQFHNLNIFSPTTLGDLKMIFDSIDDISGSVVIRYSNNYLDKNYALENVNDLYDWTIKYSQDNYSATVITYGNDIDILIKEMQINAFPFQVIEAKCLNPLDEKTLDSLISQGKPIIVYSQDFIIGGLGEKIKDYLKEHHATNPIKIIGVKDSSVVTGNLSQMKNYYHLDIHSLIDELKSITL